MTCATESISRRMEYGEQIPMHSTPIDFTLLCMRPGHAVDDGSLQHFFIHCQFTYINIISWLICEMSFNAMHTFT